MQTCNKCVIEAYHGVQMHNIFSTGDNNLPVIHISNDSTEDKSGQLAGKLDARSGKHYSSWIREGLNQGYLITVGTTPRTKMEAEKGSKERL